MECAKLITTKIIIAVEEGNVEILTELISQYGADWKGKCNLLVVALQRKKLNVAELLLTKSWGFDITKLIIPLNVAASLNVINSKEIIEKLLERGADINSSYKGKTPLHVAVASKSIDHIDFLVNHGANVNGVCTSCGEEGYTSLHFAAAMKDNDYAVNLLLSKGANINAKADNGITPLHCALIKHNEIVVRMLLEHGANVDDQNEDGNTALYLAVKTGCLPIVKDVLKYCPSIDIPSNRKSLKHTVACNHFDHTEALLKYGFSIDCEDARNDELLHCAVKSENTKIVEDLLKYGANVNRKAENGDTPLHVALKGGNERIVRTLLQSNANVDDEDGDGNTVICLAVKTNCSYIVKDILKYAPKIDIRKKMNPIITAVMSSSNNIRIANALLDYGFTIDPEDVNSDINSTFKGRTPLHVATEKGWLGIIEFLLNHGANVNCVSTSSREKGYTSLHFAAMKSYYRIISLLLSKGANINAMAEDGETALHIAVNFDNKKSSYQAKAITVQLLLDEGADVHCKRRDELTPLLVSIKARNEFVVKILLQNGANVDDQDEHGNTALNLAVRTGRSSIVKDILKYCPGIDIQSNRKSLINAVRRRFCGDIVGALVDYGFTLNREDANNAQLFHNAIWMGSSKLVKWFLKNGANPNGLDCTGDTPLHTAAENKSKNIIQYCEPNGIYAKRVNKAIGEFLISYGADINAKSIKGKTVLICAVEEYNLELIKLLLTHGVDVKNCVRLLAAPLYEDSIEFVEAIFPYLNINAILSKISIEVYSSVSDENVELVINNDIIIETSKYRLAIFVKTLLYYGADVNILYESLYFYDNDWELDRAGLRLCHWPSYKNQYEQLVGSLHRRIFQLKTANLYVSEQNLKLISESNEQLKNFEKECKEEISKMKNNQIKNAGITFFEILENDTNRLAKYMKNENIMKALNLEKYKTEYPIYARMIELNSIKAIKKKESVDQANLVFSFVFKYFNKLPHRVTAQILDYLSDEDLRKLLLTFKCCDLTLT